MGCKCKQAYDAAIQYSDDAVEKNGNRGKNSLLNVIGQIFVRIIIGICAIIVFAVGIPFFVVYVIISLLLGKEMHININKIIKRKRH